MTESISIATANTFYSQLLRQPQGLEPFAERNVDVLLLQEVLKIDEDAVRDSLAAAGYSLVHRDSNAR